MTESSERLRHSDSEVSLADLVWFLRRRWLMILVAGLGAGVLTALTMVVLKPPTYEASATLIIVPPRFSSELKAPTLTVQGYQKLLESDAVLAEAKQRLLQNAALDAQAALRLGKNVSTRIFVSRRSEETELAPMIQAIARFEEPETSAQVANTWAEVFLDRTQQLMGGTTTATVELIDRQYPQARQDLMRLETERIEIENGLQRQYDEAETRWDRTISAHRTETSELLATYSAETRRLLEEFSGERSLETRATQLEALKKAYEDLQSEQALVESQLDQSRLQLEAAKQQIAATSQYLNLKKSITDDALWEALAESGKSRPDVADLESKILVTQELNPVYIELSSRAARIEMELNALSPRAEQLDTRLSAIAQQMKALDSSLRADKAEYVKLEREREAGFEILKERRSLALVISERDKARELAELARTRDARLAQIERGISQQSALFENLADSYNEATLAKAEQTVEDVRLGAPAVAPERPTSRHLTLSVGFAMLLGLIFGGAIAAVVDVSRRTDMVGK